MPNLVGFSFSLILLCQARSQMEVVAAGVLFGLTHGYLYPLMNALMVEIVSPRHRGKAMALYSGSFNLGFTVGVLLFGYVAELWGYQMMFSLASAVALCATLPFLALPGLGRGARPSS